MDTGKKKQPEESKEEPFGFTRRPARHHPTVKLLLPVEWLKSESLEDSKDPKEMEPDVR